MTNANWVNSFCVGHDNFPWCLREFINNPNKPSDGPRYLASLYWVYATFATVGYGDVTASISSDVELGMRCCFVLCVSSCGRFSEQR